MNVLLNGKDVSTKENLMSEYVTTRAIITFWELTEDGKETILSSSYLADADIKDAVKRAKATLKELGEQHGAWITTQELQDDVSLLQRHVWETTSKSPMILFHDGKIRTIQELNG